METKSENDNFTASYHATVRMRQMGLGPAEETRAVTGPEVEYPRKPSSDGRRPVSRCAAAWPSSDPSTASSSPSCGTGPTPATPPEPLLHGEHLVGVGDGMAVLPLGGATT